ncbi:hypothetical protein QJS10_CPA03g01747 [Acorus calamus]|uniref:Bulb-type lectin domain-containing protein n=1 Tax=Acorus calamus TaxID=4465 RepID=A0AAV9F2K7_ACOCL|nr:hypothetical protein QJS10_CPA03g01747 [Acorus calamus]
MIDKNFRQQSHGRPMGADCGASNIMGEKKLKLVLKLDQTSRRRRSSPSSEESKEEHGTDGRDRRGRRNKKRRIDDEEDVMMITWRKVTAVMRMRGRMSSDPTTRSNGKTTVTSPFNPLGLAPRPLHATLRCHKQGLRYPLCGLLPHPRQLQTHHATHLVLYDNGRRIWRSNTGNAGRACHATLERDGRLVIYPDNGGNSIWDTSKPGDNLDAGYVLVLQEDRNVVIYGPAKWETNRSRPPLMTKTLTTSWARTRSSMRNPH